MAVPTICQAAADFNVVNGFGGSRSSAAWHKGFPFSLHGPGRERSPRPVFHLAESRFLFTFFATNLHY